MSDPFLYLQHDAFEHAQYKTFVKLYNIMKWDHDLFMRNAPPLPPLHIEILPLMTGIIIWFDCFYHPKILKILIVRKPLDQVLT